MTFDSKNIPLDQTGKQQTAPTVGMPADLDPVDNLQSLVDQQKKKDKAGQASLDNLNTGNIYHERIAIHKPRPHQDSQISVHDKVLQDKKTGVELDTPEASKLKNWADKNLQGLECINFKKDMVTFEQRAREFGLDSKEVAGTYEQVQRLLEGNDKNLMSPIDRIHVAEQVLHQAAMPKIYQGHHTTCSVAMIESRTYTRTPAAAVRLVADICLQGEYHAPDGTIVKLDPKAHDESKIFPAPEGYRSFASEIFQVTAVNIHYVKENTKSGSNIRRYEQVDPDPGDSADTGERLFKVTSSEKKEEVKDASGHPLRTPDLYDRDEVEISNAITGKIEKDVYITHAGNTNSQSDQVTQINSEIKLASRLQELKEHGKLPVIIRVNSLCEPFYTDSGQRSADDSGGAHVVTITDYDPGNLPNSLPKVCIRGSGLDATDYGKDNPISLHDLYTAMQTTKDAKETLQQGVEWNKKHHQPDYIKEMEAIRLDEAIHQGRVSDEQARDLMQKLGEHWHQDSISDLQKEQELYKLTNLIKSVDDSATQQNLLHSAAEAGLVSKYMADLMTDHVKNRHYINEAAEENYTTHTQKCIQEIYSRRKLNNVPAWEQKWENRELAHILAGRTPDVSISLLTQAYAAHIFSSEEYDAALIKNGFLINHFKHDNPQFNMTKDQTAFKSALAKLPVDRQRHILKVIADDAEAHSYAPGVQFN